MKWIELKEIVSSLPTRIHGSSSPIISDDALCVTLSDKAISYTKDEFDVDFDYSLIFSEKNILSNGTYYEVLLDELSRSTPWIHSSRYPYEICDNERGLTYRIGKPSMQFYCETLNRAKDDWNTLRGGFFHGNAPRRDDEDVELNFYSYLTATFRLPPTLTITSKSNNDLSTFAKLADALLFSVAYNTNTTFTVATSFDSIYLRSHKRPYKRIRQINEVEAPKREYSESLTSQYYKGVSASDPFIAFLCFYHIMEHRSEGAYREDMIRRVRDEITSPKFSSKRNRDIARIIELVQNRLAKNAVEYQIDEQEALELTLKKYIPSIDELKDELNQYDPALLAYYKGSPVPFSKGDEVDFSIVPSDKIYKKIAARIYKTRNAIVHNKSNDFRTKERGLYDPFKDEDALLKEIPLMRFIAEIVIINDSVIV